MPPPSKKKVIKKKKKALPPPPPPPPDHNAPLLPTVRGATLAAAVSSADTRSLTRLVHHYDFKRDLIARDGNGSTLIHLAVRRKDWPTLCQLLAYEVIDLNVRESRAIGGCTAVHLACQFDFQQGLEALLAAGANPSLAADNSLGETPLIHCCRHNLEGCGSLLVRYGVDVMGRDSFGNNASFWALRTRHESMIRILGLPTAATVTADEFLKMQIAKNPNFTLPVVKLKKKSTGLKKKKK